MDNKTLMTDFYELTMAQTYFMEGKKDEQLYFDIFFRNNPFNGGYTMSGGLTEIVDYINNFHFDEETIEYLRSLNTFNEEFLDYLKNLKFTGDVYAMPDGTAAFPNEAIITVKGDAVTVQLLETALLAAFNHASLVTTASKRITEAAKGIPVMEFGARRARGIDSAIEASKYAYIGGCSGTSNTYAGMKYDIPVLGTMAHSLITEHEDEYEAFLEYAKVNPDNGLFLVDTYDTIESGIPNAIRVSKEYLEPNGYRLKGVRIDSGDLLELSKKARIMLDEAGYPDASICLSNGLDEYMIEELLENGAYINSIGAGDNIAASCERVGGVYKLVAKEINGKIDPRIKVSNDKEKTTTPGFKKVYRIYDKETGLALGDVLNLNEQLNNTEISNLLNLETENFFIREMQVPIFKDGELVYDIPSIKDIKKYCEEEYKTLPSDITTINNPKKYRVALTKDLENTKEELINKHKKVLKKVKKDA